MFKKTLISVAVASSLGLSGCFDSGDSGANANPDYRINDTTIDRSIVRPIYDPNPIAEEPAFPINADLLLLLGATQSANFDFTGLSTGTSPADDALNRLSGFSTSGAFTLKFDGSLNPASVQAGATVFLLPLNVAPAIDSAPEALPNTNPSGIDQTNPFDLSALPKFRADVVSVDGSSNNAIRVVPLEPLKTGQKYLVVATNDIVGANGKPIARSVQDVALADGVLGNSALGNVKSLLQASDALANGFLAQAIPSNTPESALAYTFTTNADTEVLEAMMAPAAFGSALGQKIGFTAQLKAVRDNFPTLNFSQLTEKLADIGEKAALLGAGELDPATLTAQELAAITALVNVEEKVTPATIGAAIQAEVGDTIHVPQPRPSFFYDTKSATELTTIQGLPGDNTIALAAQQVLVSQGAITLPYFQSLPGETGAGIVNGSWTGSTSLEAGLNETLSPGEEIFQFLRDIDGQLNVNGYFPFPEQQATTTVPVVIFHPVLGTAAEPTSCGSTGAVQGATIFQHGVTVDRSVSMLPAILLAQSTCQAVIAIDQPLHGLAGETIGTVPGLEALDPAALTATVQAVINTLDPTADAQTIGALTALINADYIGERHFGYTANESLQPVAADLANVSSGSLFINPLNMLNSRDNVRQGVVDLLNVAASLQTFNLSSAFQLSEEGSTPPVLAGADFSVNFVGHSLGGISGTTFSSLVNGEDTYTVVVDPATGTTADLTRNALANQALAGAGFTYPQLNSVVLHNTGGQGTRLIENSPTISGRILNGLAAAGVTQGSSAFENFFYIFQSAVDATDPVNFAVELGASTSTSSLLITEVVGDSTVPNEANVNPLGSAFSAPLAGTEPLMALLDIGLGGTSLADGSEGLGIIDSSATSGLPAPVASFFNGANPCSDANHGTFVAPVAPNEQCPGGVANTSGAFAAMVTQTAAAISGAPGIPADATILPFLGDSPTLENALDQDQAQ
ncbi:MECDP-synthase [Marinobacter sp. M216]|uniref:MECDP-synthase n=1 Tax=Marinobacter albus TaxID=3030833 RepID=A0ABT7HF89_9GAMM|nr:MECDP-synthase [Marinobacter sp. M216]MDK9559033.1 MECDP-synthase [Marinobacter sp. M216]